MNNKVEVSSADLKKNYLAASLFMVIGTLAFAVMTAFVKFAGARFEVSEVVFFRCFLALIFTITYLSLKRKLSLLRTNNLLKHGLRSFFGLLSMSCYFSAYKMLPLGEAHSFGRTKVIFIALFAAWFLKERLSAHRIFAALIGFLGIIIMFNPTDFSIGTGSILAIFGGIFAALAMVEVRILSRTEDPFATVCYFMLFGSLVSLSFFSTAWKMPVGFEWLVLAATGVFGAIGQTFMVKAYRSAEASFVGPFDYLELVWAIIIGLLVWNEIPGIWVILGSLMVFWGQLMMYQKESNSRSASSNG